MVRTSKKSKYLKFNTAIITYPSDYDGLLTIQSIEKSFNNDFIKQSYKDFKLTTKVVIAKETADEQIQRDHYHIYFDSSDQYHISPKYFDIPLPEPVICFVHKDSTRFYKLYSELESSLGIDSYEEMAPKIETYIQNFNSEFCQEHPDSENIIVNWEFLKVAHPNIELKKQYGDKYFMLRYVVKQHLVCRANFDVDEELNFLQDNQEKLKEKVQSIIEQNLFRELNIETVDELIILLKKYKAKLKNKKKTVNKKFKNAKEEEQENWEWELCQLIRKLVYEKIGITKNEVMQILYKNEHLYYIFCRNYINYSRLINDCFKNRPNAKPVKNYDFKFWVPNKLYNYLLWLDKWVMNWTLEKKDQLEHRPKGLILIGGSRTGKTSLISLLGDFSYIKNVWNIDNWEYLPPFTVMDDMDAVSTDGKGLPFCWFKPFFGAQDALTVTDKYRAKQDIVNGKPLIWINNYDINETFQDQKSLDYINKNMIYVNIGDRSLFEPPRDEIERCQYSLFDPKKTWYYQNVILKQINDNLKNENKRKISDIQKEYENCEFCNKLIKNCTCNKENEPPKEQQQESISIPDSTTDPDELEPLNQRKRRLSIEAESREKFESDKGRLLENIHLQINASQELLNDYERKINQLLVENTRLNEEYNTTFKNYWYRNNNNKDLLNYRESIIFKICENNDLIEKYNKCLEKQKCIYNFLYNCNYYVDKSMYE